MTTRECGGGGDTADHRSCCRGPGCRKCQQPPAASRLRLAARWPPARRWRAGVRGGRGGGEKEREGTSAHATRAPGCTAAYPRHPAPAAAVLPHACRHAAAKHPHTSAAPGPPPPTATALASFLRSSSPSWCCWLRGASGGGGGVLPAHPHARTHAHPRYFLGCMLHSGPPLPNHLAHTCPPPQETQLTPPCPSPPRHCRRSAAGAWRRTAHARLPVHR